MPFRLSWGSEALSAMQGYRNRHPDLAKAFEQALEHLRASGSVPGSGHIGSSFSAHVSSVFVPGYDEHVVVWIREENDRPRVVYLDPLDT